MRRRARMPAVKSINTRSELRRPIMRPSPKAPAGLSERHRWLADAAPLRLAGKQQSFGFQTIDDDRGGLGRETGQARDLDFGKAAMTADKGQDQALVIEPTPLWLVPRLPPDRPPWVGRRLQMALFHPSSAPQNGGFASFVEVVQASALARRAPILTMDESTLSIIKSE